MKKVLIVDDELDVRTFLTTVLRKAGYRSVTAENGQEGLRLAQQESPSLITLDLMMPRLDGFGFLERLQARPAAGRPPVVVLTATELSETEAVLLERAAAQVLQKATNSRATLLQAVHDQLSESIPEPVTADR